MLTKVFSDNDISLESHEIGKRGDDARNFAEQVKRVLEVIEHSLTSMVNYDLRTCVSAHMLVVCIKL